MHNNKVMARLVRFLLDAGELVRGRSPSWTVPTLFLWAGADRGVSPGGAAFPPAAPHRGVRAGEFSACCHGILNGSEQVEVLDGIRRSLDDRGV